MKTLKIFLLATFTAAVITSCTDENTTPQHSWSAMESITDNTLHEVYFLDESTGWAVGSDIMLFTGDGTTWQESTINDANHYNFYDVHFFDTDNGVVCGENTSGGAIIFYTRNGGTSWNEAETDNNVPAFFSEMVFVDNNTGYMLGEGQLWKTTDGGTSWQQINSYSEEAIALEAIGNNIWAGRSSIQYSSDGGQNWINQNIATGDKLVSTLFFVDENNGYAGTSYGGGDIMRTVDGGQNWEVVFSGNEFISDIFFTSETKGWALHSSSIIHTKNGTDWETSGAESNNYLNAMHFPSSSVGYAVGYQGTILKYE